MADDGKDEKNSLGEIMKFLSTSDNPVNSKEFNEFWQSCTEAEKEEFRTAKLQ